MRIKQKIDRNSMIDKIIKLAKLPKGKTNSYLSKRQLSELVLFLEMVDKTLKTIGRGRAK